MFDLQHFFGKSSERINDTINLNAFAVNNFTHDSGIVS